MQMMFQRSCSYSYSSLCETNPILSISNYFIVLAAVSILAAHCLLYSSEINKNSIHLILILIYIFFSCSPFFFFSISFSFYLLLLLSILLVYLLLFLSPPLSISFYFYLLLSPFLSTKLKFYSVQKCRCLSKIIFWQYLWNTQSTNSPNFHQKNDFFASKIKKYIFNAKSIRKHVIIYVNLYEYVIFSTASDIQHVNSNKNER